MAFRYWLSGPRILNGLVRPGISFYARDLARQRPPQRPMASKDVALVGVFTRSTDGAVIFGNQRTMTPESLGESSDKAEGLTMPIAFAFRSHEAADAVLAGARQRLAKAATDAHGWLRGVSAGQVASAIKAEAHGLSHAFDIVHVRDGEEPKPRKPSWIALAAIGIWAVG
jgi:hypothetical protein